MTTAGSLGVDVYERVRDDLIERTVNAKLARLASLDPADVTVSEWRSASTLLVMSLHDTMNHTARSNGAICVERQPVDRLPNVVALSNHGGPDAAVRASTTGALLDDEDVLSLDPTTMRAIANAYRWAFDAYGPDDVAFNRPYLGGFETRHIGPWLRSRAANAIVSCDGVPVALQLGAWQNEFLREFLLGPDATEHLTAAGRGLGDATRRPRQLARRTAARRARPCPPMGPGARLISTRPCRTADRASPSAPRMPPWSPARMSARWATSTYSVASVRTVPGSSCSTPVAPSGWVPDPTERSCRSICASSGSTCRSSTGCRSDSPSRRSPTRSTRRPWERRTGSPSAMRSSTTRPGMQAWSCSTAPTPWPTRRRRSASSSTASTSPSC